MIKPGKYDLTITKRAFSSRVAFSAPDYREFCTVSIDHAELDTMSEFCAIGWEPTTRRLLGMHKDNIRDTIKKMRTLPVGSVYAESVELLF